MAKNNSLTLEEFSTVHRFQLDEPIADPQELDLDSFNKLFEPKDINSTKSDPLQRLRDERERDPLSAPVSKDLDLPDINEFSRSQAMKIDLFDSDADRLYPGFWDEMNDAGARGIASVLSGLVGTFAEIMPHMPSTSAGAPSPSFEQLQAFKSQAVQEAQRLDAKAQFLFELSKDPALQPSEGGGAGGFLANAIGGTWPYMAASMTATLTTGSPLGAFAVGFSVEGDNAYREAIAAGATEEQAQMERLIVGTINGAIEQLQVQQILGFTKAGRKELTRVAKNKILRKLSSTKAGEISMGLVGNSIKEGFEEAGQELTGIFAKNIHGEWTPLGKALRQVGSAATGGAVVAPLMAGGGMIGSTSQAKSESNWVSDPKNAKEWMQNVELIALENSLNEVHRTSMTMEFEAALRQRIDAAYAAGDMESLRLIQEEINPKSDLAKQVDGVISLHEMDLNVLSESDQDFANEVLEATGEIFEPARKFEPRPDRDGPSPVRVFKPDPKGNVVFEENNVKASQDMNASLNAWAEIGQGKNLGMTIIDLENKTFLIRLEAVETGKGSGTAALIWLTERADKSGKSIELDVGKKNVKAQALYERFGFEVVQQTDPKKIGLLMRRNPKPSEPSGSVETIASMLDSPPGKRLLDAIKTLEPPRVSEDQAAAIISNAKAQGFGPEALDILIEKITGKNEIKNLSMQEARSILKELDDLDAISSTLAEDIVSADVAMNIPGAKESDLIRIAKAAGSSEAYNRAVLHANRLGFPQNEDVPDLKGRQKIFLDNIVRAAKDARKQVNLQEKNNEVNILNPYQSFGYMLAAATRKSGIPLRRMWSDIVAQKKQYSRSNEKLMWDGLKRAGVHRLGIMTSRESSMKIAKWLDEKDNAIRETAWKEMAPKEQALAEELEDILQHEGAVYTRWARFVKWNYYAKKAEENLEKIIAKGKVPSKAQMKEAKALLKKAQPANAPNKALYEGRIAKENGNLLEWLSVQTWGTRKRYFMHEGNITSLLDNFPEGSAPQEVFAKEAKAGSIALDAPSETEARKKKGKLVETNNVSLSVLNHLDRLTSFAATYDKRAEFWDAFVQAKPSKQDLGLMRQSMNSVRGIFPFTQPVEKDLAKANRWFWRGHLVLNPTGSAWFAWRQLLQNAALAPSQFNMMEVAKSQIKTPQIAGWKKWMENNPNANESFRDYFGREISEARSVYRHHINLSSTISGLGAPPKALAKTTEVLNLLGFVPSSTDQMNRLFLWPLAYDIADRNVGQFEAGALDTRTLWKRLALDAMDPDYQNELQGYLDRGDFSEFKSKYAEYKVENVHFRYDPSLRGPQEAHGTGKLMLRLVNFPRGVVNIAVQNGLKPLIHGSSVAQKMGGLKTILKLMAGTSVAGWISEEVMKYPAYGIWRLLFGGGPDPGLSKALDVIESSQKILYRHSMGEIDDNEAAAQMVKNTVGQLEMFIPLSDVMVSLYENTYGIDSRQVRLYDLAGRLARREWEVQYGEKFSMRSRTLHEKLTHLVFDREKKLKPDEFKSIREILKKQK